MKSSSQTEVDAEGSPPLPRPFVLASSSPRRRELLNSLGLSFEVLSSPFEELVDGRAPREQAEYLASGKLKALLSAVMQLRSRFVLAADTLLDVDGTVLGKPSDKEEARRYITMLAGRSHEVITALAVHTPESTILIESEVTTIRISELTDKDIQWYVSTGEWQDAAGGYRIQGYGSLFVERIEGCYFNVMGLPLHLFYGMVQKSGYELKSALPEKSSAV